MQPLKSSFSQVVANAVFCGWGFFLIFILVNILWIFGLYLLSHREPKTMLGGHLIFRPIVSPIYGQLGNEPNRVSPRVYYFFEGGGIYRIYINDKKMEISSAGPSVMDDSNFVLLVNNFQIRCLYKSGYVYANIRDLARVNAIVDDEGEISTEVGMFVRYLMVETNGDTPVGIEYYLRGGAKGDRRLFDVWSGFSSHRLSK